MIPHSAGRSAGLMLRLMGERMLGLDFFFLAGGLGVGVDGPWCCFLGEAEDPSSSESDASLFGAMVLRLG